MPPLRPFGARIVAAASVLALCCVTHSLQAQRDAGEDRLWISVGAGIGSALGHDTEDADDFSRGFAGLFGLTYQPSHLMLGARVSALWGIFDDGVADVAVLAGLGTRSRTTHLSLSAGPAWAGSQSISLGISDHKHFDSTLGLGLQVQALGILFEGLGLGLIGTANINKHQSFGGIMATIAFGRLARKS